MLIKDNFIKIAKRYFSKDATIAKEIVPQKLEISQAPNRAMTWSERQRPRYKVFVGPQFTQIDLEAQPKPLAAIELIKADPIRYVDSRQVSCSGDGPLGHPKIFINLVISLFL